MLTPLGLIQQLTTSFGLGLATPLTAVCVIPLYPGFVAYLAGRDDADRLSIGAMGALVAAGVLTFMTGIGLLFTTVLQASLTGVIGVVSPIAFVVLAAFGVALLADIDVRVRLPSISPPGSDSDSPALSAFGYGFYFGAIVLPCNPGFIGVFFARAFLFTDPVTSLGNFLGFGAGIAAPLVALAVLSDRWSDRVIGALTTNRSHINRVTGAIMLAIAAYYLVAVFHVLDPLL